MTFILSAVRSSYSGCEKTEAACEVHTALPALANGVIRSKVKTVGG